MSGQTEYRFAMDSGYGWLEAESWEEACEKLERMVPQVAIDDGGWGEVEHPQTGERYQIGRITWREQAIWY